MQITRSSIDTQKGPADWFTGDVYIDAVAAPAASSIFAAASVHFTPGARTAWHTHPHGQTIFVTEGVGRCQREGGPIEEIRPGDRVFFEPGENHWHGAAPSRFMVHIAMQQVDETGSPVTWGEHVTDEQYGVPAAVARILITGSAGGLGRAAADTLRQDGHDVIVHARSADRLDGRTRPRPSSAISRTSIRRGTSRLKSTGSAASMRSSTTPASTPVARSCR